MNRDLNKFDLAVALVAAPLGIYLAANPNALAWIWTGFLLFVFIGMIVRVLWSFHQWHG